MVAQRTDRLAAVAALFFQPIPSPASQNQPSIPLIDINEALISSITKLCLTHSPVGTYSPSVPACLAGYRSYDDPNDRLAVVDQLLERLYTFVQPCIHTLPSADREGTWNPAHLPPVRSSFTPFDLLRCYQALLSAATMAYEWKQVPIPPGFPQALILNAPPAGQDLFMNYLKAASSPAVPVASPQPPGQASLSIPPSPPSLSFAPPHLQSSAAYQKPSFAPPPQHMGGMSGNTGLPPQQFSNQGALNAFPQQTLSQGRRIDVTPKSEEDKLVFGKADIGAAALSSLVKNDPRQAAWQQRVSASKGTVASQIPLRALQHQLCDRVTRQCVKPMITPENSTAFNADITAREHFVYMAIKAGFRGREPPESLVKRFQSTALPIRATLMPSLASCAESKTTRDFFGDARSSVSLPPDAAIDLIKRALLAAWPEFDWAPLVELIDLVKALVSWSEKAKVEEPTSNKHMILRREAADLLYEGLLKIEQSADFIRYDDAAEDVIPSNDICGAATFTKWVRDEELRINKAAVFAETYGPAAGTSTALLPAPGDRPPLPAKVGTLNAALPAWHSTFPNVCIFHHCHPRGCTSQNCPHKESHAITLDPEKLSAFKKEHMLG